jgi:inositol hexakisphosphate/diphosphoinositol-pentakisphosphate kinase
MVCNMLLTTRSRVKLPKTFLAVNLSDAFIFQEKERHNSEGELFEMKSITHSKSQPPTSGESLTTPAEATAVEPTTADATVTAPSS